MFADKIVLQSAGSLSVAIFALLMMALEIIFLIRKSTFILYGWSAVISFSSIIYAIAIFFEYNAPPGIINHSAGLAEFTAIILLIHCLYGFTFAYFGIETKRYHFIAGIFHTALVVLLWTTDLIVADTFVIRNFAGLTQPFIESGLGPLGLFFEVYAVLASIGAIIIWLRHKSPDRVHKTLYLSGIIFWTALGIHDGMASLGFPGYHYVMEYGFFGFSFVILWVVFSKFYEMAAEDKYRVITEFANDGILVVQGEKAVFGNPACNALIGRSAFNLSVQDLLNTVVPEDRQKLLDHYTGLMHSKEIPDVFPIRIRRPQVEEKIVEIKATAITYRNKPAVLAILRDVTQRVREEEALKKSEEKIARLKKMESLGLLAGGVAHDLNNVLAGIVSYPDLILMDLPEESPLIKPILTMQDSGKRATAIVQDLLTVARGVAIEKRPLNMNDVIDSYFMSPEHNKLVQYHPAVTITTELDPRLLGIKGSPIHISKAVMNLVSNAAEAIGGSGRVTVATMNRYVDRPLKGYEDVRTGEYAVLVVADDGPGISPEDLNRIFEPFYTKKVMGRSGTGLGLTLVWNVVQDHAGYIDVASDDHNGTRFELYFPITREAVWKKEAPQPIEKFQGRGEMILVVDDVQSQREICCRMLEKLGYRAESVSSGEAAVDYVKNHCVDLLVLDMIMDPGIDGSETYARIKAIHPEQKAIIVSGFSETEQVKKALQLGAGRYLKKPIIIEEFGRAVKAELAN